MRRHLKVLDSFGWFYYFTPEFDHIMASGGLRAFPGALETGWDLGHFAAVAAPGQMSPGATKYKQIVRD